MILRIGEIKNLVNGHSTNEGEIPILKSFRTNNQLEGGGRKASPANFRKQKKSALILQKSALFVCIYGLNSYLKCSSNSISQKKHHNVSLGALLLDVVHETFIEVPLFQETSPAPKSSWLSVCKDRGFRT